MILFIKKNFRPNLCCSNLPPHTHYSFSSSLLHFSLKTITKYLGLAKLDFFFTFNFIFNESFFSSLNFMLSDYLISIVKCIMYFQHKMIWSFSCRTVEVYENKRRGISIICHSEELFIPTFGL